MKREEVLTVDETIKFVDSRTAAVAERKELVTFEGHFNKNGMECHYGTRCPYISGGDVARLFGERDYLSQRLDEMERVMALAKAEIEKLHRENGELKEEKDALRCDLKRMLGKIFKPQVKPHPDAGGLMARITGCGSLPIRRPPYT